MANKLISDLGARANVLVTDLMEFEPAAGAPSEKGTVTQIFTDASGNLAIDRDARQLFGTNGTDIQVEWKVGQLLDNGTLCVDWANRKLLDSTATDSVNWTARLAYGALGEDSIAWDDRELRTSPAGAVAANWQNRQLIGSDGTTVILDWNTTTPASVVQRVFSTATDPNGAVTATKPAICYGDDGSLWVKTTAGPDNTGWVALLNA